METNEAFRKPIRRQPQLVNWLRLATDRLGEAQNERIRAVVKAYESGLSISSIAAATRKSTGRVQQLLGSYEATGWIGQRPQRRRHISRRRVRHCERVLQRRVAGHASRRTQRSC